MSYSVPAEVAPDEPEPPARPARGRIVAYVLFGLVYAWDLARAIANLVALLAYAQAAGHSLNSYAWLVLGTAILVPPAIYATVFVLGRGEGTRRLVVMLGAGICASAAIGLTLEALLRS